jgi:hypothetical protein
MRALEAFIFFLRRLQCPFSSNRFFINVNVIPIENQRVLANQT